MTRRQYGMFALVCQTLCRMETIDGIEKCRLFSQARKAQFRPQPAQEFEINPRSDFSCPLRAYNAIKSGYFRRFWVLEVDDDAREDSSEEEYQHLGNDSESEELDLKRQVFVNVVTEFLS